MPMHGSSKIAMQGAEERWVDRTFDEKKRLLNPPVIENRASTKGRWGTVI